MAIKFEVPYNGKDDVVRLYLKNKQHIFMVYGRAEDGYPQGRKTKNLPPITIEKLFKHAAELKEVGIEFNYLLNGSCYGNKEYNKEYQRKIIQFVKTLLDNGITTVTVGNVYIIELIKNKFPEIKIFGSVILEVDCLARLEKIASMGVEYICLSKTLLKDFTALKKIWQYLKNKQVKAVLLANDPCLHHCAFTAYHNNVLSHQTGDGIEVPSYCRLHCTREFLIEPHRYISASFIRPEDIGVYENIGFNLIKLCDRKQTTPWIERVLNAYIARLYIGNLADLMAPWNRSVGKYPEPKEISINSTHYEDISTLRDQLRSTPFIDNKKLDGYINFWLNHKAQGCRDEDCRLCGYCHKIASKAIDINNGKIIIKNIDIVLDSISSSD